jgi:hypothetical protein
MIIAADNTNSMARTIDIPFMEDPRRTWGCWLLARPSAARLSIREPSIGSFGGIIQFLFVE